MNATDWLILLLFSIFNIWFTWKISLKERRFHGIYRFVAFESIILLVLMQWPVWFRDPFSWYQIISWILLFASLLVALSGFNTYYRQGKPRDLMENTTWLIKVGLYRYIRHPLYCSLILGGFGIMMKNPEWLQIVISIINFIALFFTARVEEGEMTLKFGKEYSDYMKTTKMFLPFII